MELVPGAELIPQCSTSRNRMYSPSAPIERVFSHAGLILSSRRTNMNEDLFRNLVLLRVNQHLLYINYTVFLFFQTVLIKNFQIQYLFFVFVCSIKLIHGNLVVQTNKY